jgi:cation diffusion facilitator CzcD-associated flavoprotein CzcO
VNSDKPGGAGRSHEEMKAMEHFDVLVVGAGISGVGAAYHLKKRCPNTTFAIFEARESLGGTWDLFRYPGVRSDSDMYTLGFSFRPWTEAKAIADGPSILKYLRETVEAYGIAAHIRFGRKVKAASWDSAVSRWTVDYEEGPERAPRQVTCNVLHMCAGYYDYAAGHRPRFEGEESFRGVFVHPQFWPKDLDYAGKRVVVIGSGATAVTLVRRWPRPPLTSPCCSARPPTSSRGRRRTPSPTSCARACRRCSPTVSSAGATCCSASISTT